MAAEPRCNLQLTSNVKSDSLHANDFSLVLHGASGARAWRTLSG